MPSQVLKITINSNENQKIFVNDPNDDRNEAKLINYIKSKFD